MFTIYSVLLNTIRTGGGGEFLGDTGIWDGKQEREMKDKKWGSDPEIIKSISCLDEHEINLLYP